MPAVKPQMAYFELYGAAGMRALERCIETARENARSVRTAITS